METTIAGQPGNENTEFANGLIKGPAAPTVGQETARGSSVANSALAPEPVHFERGTTDIVFVLTDGQIRNFPADIGGRLASNYFFESFPKKVFSIHFGESCFYVKDGKVGAMLRMTRIEFFELMLTAFKEQLRGMVKPEPVEQQVLWGIA